MGDLGTRKSKLFILLMLTSGVRCQLENEDVTIGVYLDNSRVMGFKEETEKLVQNVAATSSAAMERGSFSIRLLNNPSEADSEDLFGVIAVSQCDDVQNIAMSPGMKNEGKVMMAITDAGCNRINRPSTITIPLVQGNNDIIQVISDLRTKNTITWNDIIVIVDNSVAGQTDEIMAILSRPTENNAQTSVVVMDISVFDSISAGISQIFENLGPRPGEPKKRQFLAILSKANVGSVQRAAINKKLNGPNYQWLYVIPDTQSLNYDMTGYLDNIVDGDNVAFAFNMSIENANSNCNNGYDCVLDQLITEFANQLSKALATELELFNQVSQEEWDEIKPTQGQRASTIVKAIEKQVELLPTCAVCNQWGIEAVEIKGADRFDLIKVADWRPGGGLMFFDDIFPHVTGGFRKRVIRVTSVHYPPFQIFQSGPDGEEYTGLIFKILTEIGMKLNFTYAVRTPADGLWGVRDAQGNFNGMIKMVEDKEVMLGAAAFTVSTERMTAVNFTNTLVREPYAFMIARPTEMSRVLIFIDPFANDTWVWIGITVLIMGPILFLVHSSSPYYDYYGTRDKTGLFTIQNCSWYVYGAILQQGGSKLPDAHSGRLLVSIWWLFVTVIVTTYSGNLVAFLTFPQVQDSAANLQDLLDGRGSTSWGYVRGTILSDYFRNAEGRFQEIGEKAVVHPKQTNELLRQVRVKNHAFIEWKTNLLFTMRQEFNRTSLCQYSLGREEFYFENVAMTLSKDNPYKHLFNEEIKRLHETGLLMKWKTDFWPRENKCSSTNYGADVLNRTVSMADMQGSFILLIIGFLVALLVIFGECCVRLCSSKSIKSASSTKTLVKSLVA